ncbi:MAG: hypothetical protein GX113_02930 [Actinobacteria bacterium]|nr:hypothetical protein [Actinomycetota bacterium]
MPPEGLIYVVTGEKGSGKSTVCARVARTVAKNDFVVAGLLTERIDDGEWSASRRVVDLRSGESRPLGSEYGECARRGRRAVPPAETRGMVTTDPLTPGWDFNAEAFAWADATLSQATPCDLLVVDELGPLELLGGRGWASALEVLRCRDYSVALVVCRPKLLEELKKQLGPVPISLFEVTIEGRDALPTAIMTMMPLVGARATAHEILEPEPFDGPLQEENP